jgi:SAM-dependent methyltransferase
MRSIDQLMTTIKEVAAARRPVLACMPVLSHLEEDSTSQSDVEKGLADTELSNLPSEDSLESRPAKGDLDSMTLPTRPDNLPPSARTIEVRSVSDFTKLSDDEFIGEAYRYILGREPDHVALRYLAQLERGIASKVEILNAITSEPEARNRKVRIRGLKLRYLVVRPFRIRFVGYGLRILSALVRLPRHVRMLYAKIDALSVAADQRQEKTNEKLADLREDTNRNIRTAIEKIERSFAPFIAKIGALSVAADQRQEKTNEKLADLREDTNRNIRTAIENIERSFAPFIAKIDALSVAADQRQEKTNEKLVDLRESTNQILSSLVGQITNDLYLKIGMFGDRLTHVENSLATPQGNRRRSPAILENQNNTSPPASPDGNSSIPGYDYFYSDFESKFRGKREDIKTRQKVYLSYLTTDDNKLKQKPVFDIGCGRGEWLELLTESGIAATGVDVNTQFVRDNKRQGLSVVLSDAVEFLRSQPNESARAITGFHIIEHLPFTTLLALLDQSLRVLAPAGIAIFETPNPENLITASHKFYFDPTHIRPIPPSFADYLLRQRGFDRVEILRLHEDTGAERNEVDNLFLKNLLFGPRDYGVIAYKS